MNEFGGLASTWLTIVMAWAVHRALLHQRASTSFDRQWRTIAAVCWGLPLAIELGLYFGLYRPYQLLGPQPTVPWCHWKHDVIYLSLLLYLNVALAILYCTVTYIRICRGIHQMRTLLSDEPTEPLAPQTPSFAPSPVPPIAASSLWTIDSRLASYLSAFLVSQVPAFVHRTWQVAAGDAPHWLAVAHASTQPAQGFLNALVYIHHMRAPLRARVECCHDLWRVLRCKATRESTALTE